MKTMAASKGWIKIIIDGQIIRANEVTIHGPCTLYLEKDGSLYVKTKSRLTSKRDFPYIERVVTPKTGDEIKVDNE